MQGGTSLMHRTIHVRAVSQEVFDGREGIRTDAAALTGHVERRKSQIIRTIDIHTVGMDQTLQHI